MTEELKQAATRNHGPIQETDLYDFAGWLTTRPGVMTVGRSCEVGPLSEAVAEYIKTFPERFALTQRPAAQGVPEGFVLVPVEPTQAMLDALHSSAYLPGCYRAMLAAAQAKGGE